MSISIKVNEADLKKINRAAQKVLHRTMKWRSMMPFRGAQQYSLNVLEAINQQKYAGGYARYRWDKYTKWKQKNVGHLKFWVLFGDLLNAIKPYHMGTNSGAVTYLGGIKTGIYDKGGKSIFDNSRGRSKEIAWYARNMEFGNSRNNQPARPVFGPEFELYKHKGWFNLGAEALKDIARMWR